MAAIKYYAIATTGTVYALGNNINIKHSLHQNQ